MRHLPLNHRLQDRRYIIAEVLGEGGFGITYRAMDTRLNRWTAIKEYLPIDFADREGDHSTKVKALNKKDCKENFDWGLKAFRREAENLGRIKHRNVVTVFDHFDENDTAYIIMELVNGRRLVEFFEDQGQLPELRARNLIRQLLSGLKETHDNGILHLDMSPKNVIVSKVEGEDVPVLIDFGASRNFKGARGRSVSVALVTSGYSAPEQYSAIEHPHWIGTWTDVYSVGAIAYEAITGNRPPESTSRLMDDEMVPAVLAGKGRCSFAMLHAIDRALTLGFRQRIQNVHAFQELIDGRDIEPLSPSPQPKPPPSSTPTPPLRPQPPRPRSPIWNQVSIAAAFLLIGGGFWVFLSDPFSLTVPEPADGAYNAPPSQTGGPSTTPNSEPPQREGSAGPSTAENRTTSSGGSGGSIPDAVQQPPKVLATIPRPVPKPSRPEYSQTYPAITLMPPTATPLPDLAPSPQTNVLPGGITDEDMLRMLCGPNQIALEHPKDCSSLTP